MAKCDYCLEQARWVLFHRDGSESYICDKCERPTNIRSIFKVGLEFKSDNFLYISSEKDFNE